MMTAHYLSAHCQMPCGIYDDQLRFDMMEEDLKTIEKAMNQINKLSCSSAEDRNQVVRWIETKELMAQNIQDVVSAYFLTQRIEVGQADYVESLKYCHELLVGAMKCKQGVDVSVVKQTRQALQDYRKLYFKGDKEVAHSH